MIYVKKLAVKFVKVINNYEKNIKTESKKRKLNAMEYSRLCFHYKFVDEFPFQYMFCPSQDASVK